MANKIRVMVVDDNDMSRRLIAFPLERDGHVVIQAASGREAIEGLGIETVDLVFLDLFLGDMSGINVLEGIKANPALDHIPVVVVSGSEDRQAASRCIEAGARGFIEKPATAAAIREAVASLGNPVSAPSRPVPPAAFSVQGLAVLDPSTIEQLQRDYDNTVTATMIERFTASASELESRILDSARAQDVSNLARGAHDLKGAARTFGLVRLAAVCSALENFCEAERTASAVALLPAFSVHFQDALSALHDFTRARRIE